MFIKMCNYFLLKTLYSIAIAKPCKKTITGVLFW